MTDKDRTEETASTIKIRDNFQKLSQYIDTPRNLSDHKPYGEEVTKIVSELRSSIDSNGNGVTEPDEASRAGRAVGSILGSLPAEERLRKLNNLAQDLKLGTPAPERETGSTQESLASLVKFVELQTYADNAARFVGGNFARHAQAQASAYEEKITSQKNAIVTMESLGGEIEKPSLPPMVPNGRANTKKSIE